MITFKVLFSLSMCFLALASAKYSTVSCQRLNAVRIPLLKEWKLCCSVFFFFVCEEDSHGYFSAREHITKHPNDWLCDARKFDPRHWNLVRHLLQNTPLIAYGTTGMMYLKKKKKSFIFNSRKTKINQVYI